MIKVIIFLIITIIHFIRYLLSKKSDYKYLFISFFIVCIPFDFSIEFYHLSLSTIAGTLGTSFYFGVPIILSLLMLPFLKKKKKEQLIVFDKFSLGLFILIGVSILNFNNHSTSATLVLAFFIVSHFLFFNVALYFVSYSQFIKGIYHGLCLICLINFFLSICFPLLNITIVTSLFNINAIEGATRGGERLGAVGVFPHPGNLALFTTIATTFFLSSYLNGCNKKSCFIFLVLNTCTLILTYSRTSYLAYIFVIFLIVFISRNSHKRLLSFSNIIKFILPLSIFIYWLIFLSPLSNVFLNTDAEDQVGNRMVHWYMALQAFNFSPIIGVGLNTHLEFFSNNISLMNNIVADEFFITNPIHNIHLIILSELGIIGLMIWILFLIKSISNSKKSIANKNNTLISLSHFGILVSYIVYGMTGWAPFSSTILPFFLIITMLKSRGNVERSDK